MVVRIVGVVWHPQSACCRRAQSVKYQMGEPNDRRNTLSLAAVAVLGLTLLPGTALAQQKPLKDQLAGTWTIVSNDNVAPDGTKRQLFGPNPKGLLILAANGQFAQIMVRADRPNFKANNRLEGTAEENKAAVQGTTATFGTWSADEASSRAHRRQHVPQPGGD
jgi:hypothetical protein